MGFNGAPNDESQPFSWPVFLLIACIFVGVLIGVPIMMGACEPPKVVAEYGLVQSVEFDRGDWIKASITIVKCERATVVMKDLVTIPVGVPLTRVRWWNGMESYRVNQSTQAPSSP